MQDDQSQHFTDVAAKEILPDGSTVRYENGIRIVTCPPGPSYRDSVTAQPKGIPLFQGHSHNVFNATPSHAGTPLGSGTFRCAPKFGGG